MPAGKRIGDDADKQVAKKLAISNDSQVCRFPSDIMQRVAFFIQDQATFFCFLEGYVESEALGSLQLVWDLSKTLGRRNVWPELKLCELKTVDCAPVVLAVGPLYPTVHFIGMSDIDLMQQFLTPSTRVAWHSSSKCTPPEPWGPWYKRLSMLNLVHVHEDNCAAERLEMSLAYFPDFALLRALEISNCRVYSMDPIFEFVRHSKLTSLKLFSIQLQSEDGNDTNENQDEEDQGGWEENTLTTKHIQDLTFWIKHQPVKSFRWSGFTLAAKPTALKLFYDTLFACDTLRSFYHSDVPMLGFTSTTWSKPLQIDQLTFEATDFNVDDMEALCQGLADSRVLTFELNTSEGSHEGFQALANALPLTQLQEVGIFYSELDDEDCGYLAAALSNSKLAKLNLAGNSVTNVGAIVLAKHIKESPHLVRLDVSCNRIQYLGASALVQAMGGHPRIPNTLLLLYQNKLDEADEKGLKSIADQFSATHRCYLKRDHYVEMELS
ncbi:Aste57867_9698 [Aphanomyces stellatus]|uniref:Aste57867_9698 protein n=1 Tax=Aphanomyces stellatus TaxID=120398 RepID=A0A485KP61_9STRA|nr:hypothetical protein As57867_009660 [Aphanomyces stellatus]VFT86577.1 Aste57867_9698 [Aphanomyces stellatus]